MVSYGSKEASVEGNKLNETIIPSYRGNIEVEAIDIVITGTE